MLSTTPTFSSFVAAGLAVGLLAMVAGCASHSPASHGFKPATAESLAPLSKVELKLTRLVAAGSEVSLPATPPITLRFDDGGKIAGRSAVNRYFGAYTLGSNGAIEWPGAGLGMTRMAGPGPAMELEQKFTQALAATTQLLTGPDGARFQSADARNLLEFAR